MTSNAQRITNIESDYATEGYVDTTVVAAAAADGVVDGAIATLPVLCALAPDSSLDTYVDGKILLSETVSYIDRSIGFRIPLSIVKAIQP